MSFIALKKYWVIHTMLTSNMCASARACSVSVFVWGRGRRVDRQSRFTRLRGREFIDKTLNWMLTACQPYSPV